MIRQPLLYIVYPYPYCWERTLFLLIEKLVAASGRVVTRVRKQDYQEIIKLTHIFRSTEVFDMNYGAIFFRKNENPEMLSESIFLGWR